MLNKERMTKTEANATDLIQPVARTQRYKRMRCEYLIVGFFYSINLIYFLVLFCLAIFHIRLDFYLEMIFEIYVTNDGWNCGQADSFVLNSCNLVSPKAKTAKPNRDGQIGFWKYHSGQHWFDLLPN